MNTPNIIITPYIPPVFRYLPKCFVDEFFADGSLQLSTALTFRENPDAQRGDKNDFKGIVEYRINDQPAKTELHTDLDAYALCTSLLLNSQMYDDFKSDSCIEIQDPVHFVQIVAHALHNVDEIIFGPCHYMQDRKFDRTTESNLTCKNDDDYRELFSQIFKPNCDDISFRKEAAPYSYQHEYRFLWRMKTDSILTKPIIVKIPEAIQFCKQRTR